MNGIGKSGPLILSAFEIYHSYGYKRYKLRFELLADSEDSWKLGGYTIVYDEALGLAGVAVCSPRDQYSRKKGVEVALSRMRTALTMRQHGHNGVLITVPRISGGKLAQELRRAALMDVVRLMDKHVWVWGTISILEVD